MKPHISIVSERPAVEAEARRRLTKWEFADLMLRQHGKCATCGQRLSQGATHDDHIVPLACGGTNALSNRQLLCRPCHAPKTDERDKGDAAKIKRMSGEKGQRARRSRNGPKMTSRGFDKTVSRRFSGEVVRKDQSNERE